MNNTTIFNERKLHCHYADLSEVNYHHLIKLNDFIIDSNRLSYSVSVCYGTHFELSVLPEYMRNTINQAIYHIKSLDQKYLIDYYTQVLKQTNNKYHIVRNSSLFQRLFTSLFHPACLKDMLSSILHFLHQFPSPACSDNQKHPVLFFHLG